MARPTYELRLRDVRTGTLRAVLRTFISVRWTRRAYGAGDFELVLRSDSVDSAAIAADTMFEVIRNGVVEFQGVIEVRNLDDPTIRSTRRANVWQLAGRDLLGFFGSQRIVGRTVADPRGPDAAETIIKAYWIEHLFGASDAARDVRTALILDFAIPATSGLGGTVEDDGRRKNLLTGITIPLARAGQVLPHVSFDAGAGGYSLAITEPRDRTVNTGALPFSVGWETVSGLTYRENLIDLVNTITVLGGGTGDARTSRERTDADSIATHFRREGVLDERNALTNAQLDQLGDAELERLITASVTALAQPRTDAQSPSLYRVDFDLGEIVTVAIPAAGVSVDRLIAEVKVDLDPKKSERVSITLGDRPKTDLAIIADAIRRVQPVQVQ